MENVTTDMLKELLDIITEKLAVNREAYDEMQAVQFIFSDGDLNEARDKVQKILTTIEKAKKKYTQLNLEFKIRDHHYFDSIYTEDPDGHTVELTTIKVNEREFYK